MRFLEKSENREPTFFGPALCMIMAPPGQFGGVPNDLIVTAYQSAKGLINRVMPTSAVVMGGPAIARVGNRDADLNIFEEQTIIIDAK